MFVYEISELLESLNSAKKDGYRFVEIAILSPSESDMTESISFDYIDDPCASENDMIDSIILPPDYYRMFD